MPKIVDDKAELVAIEQAGRAQSINKSIGVVDRPVDDPCEIAGRRDARVTELGAVLPQHFEHTDRDMRARVERVRKSAELRVVQ